MQEIKNETEWKMECTVFEMQNINTRVTVYKQPIVGMSYRLQFKLIVRWDVQVQ